MGPLVFAQPPLDTACIQIERHRFTVEQARTTLEQQYGLQHRTSLASDRGMIFPYKTPQVLRFWMKDCEIPLDMLFFREGKLVHYVDAAPPCKAEASQCPVYSSGQPADAVVELKAGTRGRLKLKPGAKLSYCSRQSQGSRK